MGKPALRVDGAGWQTICAQQEALLRDVDAIRISKKPEVIGALFEDLFREFLLRIGPSSIGIVPGFIIDKEGNRSSHFDGLIVDKEYPSLARIGPHHYVMSASVVAVLELTTNLDAKKLISIIGKSAEVERFSRKLYKENAWGSIGFMGVAVDSSISGDRIQKEFTKRKPLCHVYTLRAPHQGDEAIHCWMEGGKEGDATLRSTTSPLADLIAMQFQDALYTLASRLRDHDSVGRALNEYIHWGTAGLSVLTKTA